MNFDKFRDTAPLMQQTLPLSSLLNIGKFLSFDCGAVEGGGNVGIRCYRVCFEQELLKGGSAPYACVAYWGRLLRAMRLERDTRQEGKRKK